MSVIHIQTVTPTQTDTSEDSGDVEIKEYSDVHNSPELVREYSTPAPGEILYAYRDSDQHIVVSRGIEAADQWTKKVPANRKRVVPGQRLWTIPNNWEKRVHQSRNKIAYGLFYIPETDVWVKLSIPTNDWLVDCWYQVKEVGSLTVAPTGVGDYSEMVNVVENYEENLPNNLDESMIEAQKEIIQIIRSNWRAVEQRYEEDADKIEGLWQDTQSPETCRVDEQWVYKEQTPLFDPKGVIKWKAGVEEWTEDHETALNDVHRTLREADVLPNPYSVHLSIDGSTIEMDYYIRALEEAGCSPAGVLDYYFTEIIGLTQTERGEQRGVGQDTVSRNVKGVKSNIET